MAERERPPRATTLVLRDGKWLALEPTVESDAALRDSPPSLPESEWSIGAAAAFAVERLCNHARPPSFGREALIEQLAALPPELSPSEVSDWFRDTRPAFAQCGCLLAANAVAWDPGDLLRWCEADPSRAGLVATSVGDRWRVTTLLGINAPHPAPRWVPAQGSALSETAEYSRPTRQQALLLYLPDAPGRSR